MQPLTLNPHEQVAVSDIIVELNALTMDQEPKVAIFAIAKFIATIFEGHPPGCLHSFMTDLTNVALQCQADPNLAPPTTEE